MKQLSVSSGTYPFILVIQVYVEHKRVDVNVLLYGDGVRQIDRRRESVSRHTHCHNASSCLRRVAIVCYLDGDLKLGQYFSCLTRKGTLVTCLYGSFECAPYPAIQWGQIYGSLAIAFSRSVQRLCKQQRLWPVLFAYIISTFISIMQGWLQVQLYWLSSYLQCCHMQKNFY